MPGTVLLLAAAPAGKGCLVDAASVLPVLAAVPPAVLSGTETANVVELADPLEPQAVLTRLRAAAAAPGPLTVFVAGQIQLDRRQRLPHLALARTTPATVRYTGLPWHWIREELRLRAPGSTALLLDLHADAETWEWLRANPLDCGRTTTVHGRVAPPPGRREVAVPTYMKAVATILRSGRRPPLEQLHQQALSRITDEPAGLVLPAPGLRGAVAAQQPPTSDLPVGPVRAAQGRRGPETAQVPPAGDLPADLLLAAQGPRTAGADQEPPAGDPPAALALAAKGPRTAAPAQVPPAGDLPVGPVRAAQGRRGPETAQVPPAGDLPADLLLAAQGPRTAGADQEPPAGDLTADLVLAAKGPGTAGAAQQTPADLPVGLVFAVHGSPGAAPAQEPAAGNPAPGNPPAPDPHDAISAAVRCGRHPDADALAARQEQAAVQAHGPGSEAALHWAEVRADLAMFAGDPVRSCRTWLAVAAARLTAGQPAHAPEVEAAVDRAHHQWGQIRDAEAAREIGPRLADLRSRVPGRRQGALDHVRRQLRQLQTQG
ncbi:hypothetical protein ACIRVK_16625 [Streptomyces sp. NPDC101152]|uniref:hypothetical protein n=1 Tax=Streptomyces sp. NPDC101152 TaxID=3366116 RepID=UPI003808FE66